MAQRIFSEQLRDLTHMMTGSSLTPLSLNALLYMHKKQFGYQMQPQSLGAGYTWFTALESLPYIEVRVLFFNSVKNLLETWETLGLQLSNSTTNDGYVVVCHHEDPKFIFNSYAACRIILESGVRLMPLASFINAFFGRYSQILNEHTIKTMKHAVLVSHKQDV